MLKSRASGGLEPDGRNGRDTKNVGLNGISSLNETQGSN